MKPFWMVILLGFTLLLPARAQPAADDKYIAIYSLIQEAEDLAKNGEPRSAFQAYVDAQAKLEHFHQLYPDWNPNIVNYRLNELAQKISSLKGPDTATNPPPARVENTTGSSPAAANQQSQAQMENIESQLQVMRAQNEALQAKLKEALAAQPAAIDPSELAKAQAQIRSLMKENDLLKAGSVTAPQKIIVTDTNALAQARQQLDYYIKKYADQRARAEQLAADNEKLQLSQQLTAPNAAALAALREQNAKLQAFLANETNALAQARQEWQAYLKKYTDEHDRAEKLATENALLQQSLARTNVTMLADLSAQLSAARTEIASLKTSAAVVALEKSALENKVSQLSAELATVRAANFEARLRDLAAQRDDLRQQLAAAEQTNSRRLGAGVDTQVAALNDEVKTLRARLSVDEAKPVPFTADELALLRQPTPQPAAGSVKKPMEQMPAGTAELVVSAQQHFARHEYDQAEADYQKILNHDQNNGLVLANLATIELQQGKLDAAEKNLKAALAQSPDDAYNLSTLGFLKFRQEKYDEALDILSRAAQLAPENPEIQNYLGVTYSRKGMRLQAETALRKAIQLNPVYAPAHNNLAVIYLSQTPPSPLLARWHYQKAIAAGQPRNPDLEKLLAEKGAPVEP